jgi:hypothetical protein
MLITAMTLILINDKIVTSFWLNIDLKNSFNNKIVVQ